MNCCFCLHKRWVVQHAHVCSCCKDNIPRECTWQLVTTASLKQNPAGTTGDTKPWNPIQPTNQTTTHFDTDHPHNSKPRNTHLNVNFLNLSSNPTNSMKKDGLEELVGRGGVQWMDEVGEHKSHQHQDVCDPLVNRCSCREKN
jgi:hypothetical protein